MRNKITCLALLAILALPNISQAKSKFFVGVGFSEMYLKGVGKFTEIDIYSTNYSTPIHRRFRFGDRSGLRWHHNYQERVNLVTGFNFSESDILNLNISYNFTKKGYSPNTGRPDTDNNLSGVVHGGTYYDNNGSETTFSQFNLLKITLSNEHYISKPIFLQFGINFNHFNAQTNQRTSFNIFNESLSGNALGLIAGVGYSKQFTEKIDVVGKLSYSYMYYNKNDFGLDGLNIDFYGYSLGLETRYNFGI